MSFEKQISIKVEGTQYQIFSDDCNEKRLERAVHRLIKEQKKKLYQKGYDNHRASIMIAISAFYEYERLNEMYQQNVVKLEVLKRLLKKFQQQHKEFKLLKKREQQFQTTENKCNELTFKYEKVVRKVAEMEVLEKKYKRLLTAYEELQKKEKELLQVQEKYEQLYREHSEIEEIMSFAMEETERLTQEIALHIA